MKVKVGSSWLKNGFVEMPLAQALTPANYADGQMERIQDRAEKALEFATRTLELLVDKGIITLDEAKEVAQCCKEIEEVKC